MKKLMQKAHKGATFIEYAMLAGLVAVVGFIALAIFTSVFKATQSFG